MTDDPTNRTGRGGFWSRRSTLGKILIVGAIAVAAIAIVGAVSSPDSSDDATSAPSEQADQSDTVTGRIAGRFNRNCLLCDGRLATYVRTSDAWCAWRDGLSSRAAEASRDEAQSER